MNYIVIALIGALASVLSNRGIAVFNDGFRPIVGQYFNQEINRKELATMSFAISFGLVIGFGIPTSIAASILLIHSLLLMTDIIGSFCPNNWTGTVIAAVVGGLYGLGLLIGLEWVVDLFSKLPYDFTSALGGVSGYVVVAFAIFPAVAAGLQHGYKKGMITAAATILTYFLTKKFGIFAMGESKVALSGEGMAMLVGMLFLIAFAAQEKGEGSANVALVQGFSGNVKRIRKNWALLAVMGGLVSMGASLSLVAGDPASLALLAEGQYLNAALTALARAIGFIPLVFTTAIVTGVYGAAGCTFCFVTGILLHGHPVAAFGAGFLVLLVEIFLIQFFAQSMDRFPGVRDMGEHVRTSINRVLEVSLLAGSIVAAEAMVKEAAGLSGIGALFVVGAFLLNRVSKKPVVDMAMGPVAAIVFGILLNLLLVFGLITTPPKEEKAAQASAKAITMEVAEEASLSDVDNIIEAHLEKGEFPGAVLLVTKDGKIVYEKAYGDAQRKDMGKDLPTPRPMTTDTLFDLASVTKVMGTTQAVMHLVSEGALDLDEKVATYLPAFGENGKEAVTIRDLLTHQSGLPQWKPIFLYADHNPEAVKEYICRQPLQFPIGEEKYSDLGFQMLGFVVEAVSGKSLDQYLQETIYQPLGLTHITYRPLEHGFTKEQVAATSFGNPYEFAMVDEKNHPDFGYDCTEDAEAFERFQGWRDYTLVGEVNDGNAAMANGGVAGHAGLFSDAKSLAVLLEVLLNEGTLQDVSLYRPEVVEEFTSPQYGKAARGLGFELQGKYMGSEPVVAQFGHAGFTGTQIVADKTAHLGIVFLTNKQNMGLRTDKLAYHSTYPCSAEVVDFVRATLAGK